MSWHFSRALVVDCLQRSSLAGGIPALSSYLNTADAFLSSDKMNDTLEIHSRFGMTFVPLTADRGAGSLMLCLEASLAKPTAPLQPETTQPTRFGLKCAESWQMSLPGTSLPKTYKETQLIKPQTNAKRWATKLERFPYQRKTWVQTTFGNDIGYLHTPTTQGNYCAASMQKWPSCRNYKQAFGKVSPESHEYLMGWPIGWTGLKPLEMDRFQQWQLRHSLSLQAEALEQQ